MNLIKKIPIFLFCFTVVFKTGGQQAPGYLFKARALIESGKNNEAIDVLSEAIDNQKDNRCYLFRGDAYANIGKYFEAEEDYQYINKIIPHSGDYGLARIYALKGDASRALAYLEENLASKFRKSEKEIMLDPVFDRIENTQEWRQFWKKERYSEVETKVQEVKYYLSSGKMDEARVIATQLTGSYPEDNLANYTIALVDYEFKRYQEVITNISKLLLADRNNSDYLILLARAQTAIGNYAGAIGSITRIIESGNTDAGFFLDRAECFIKTGELEKAMNDINQYLEFYPENKKALKMAGTVAGAMGDNLKGISYFTQNIELNPGDPECWLNRANAYFTAKAWEFAAYDYGMALDLKPDIADAWLNKGIALVNTGKTEDACFDFKKAYLLGNKKATPLINKYCIH